MKTPLKVVRLADYRKKTTAAQLIADVSATRLDNSTDAFTVIRHLPEIFEQTLLLILEDFDYEANKSSKTAEACRILAASHDFFEKKFEEARA